jgi:hypothetical protein
MSSAIKVSVDTEGLDTARSALNEAERLCDEGFESVQDVYSRLNAAIEGAEEFRAALRSALRSASD